MFRELRPLLGGESYWKVRFQSGKELSELDTRPVLLENKELRLRRVEWLEDVIGSGDIGRVKEVALCTPQGEAWLEVLEPYTVFQFSRGMVSWFGDRIKNMQAVGRVVDRESGKTEAYVWDVQTQELYFLEFGLHDGFPAWREGVAPIGLLNLEVLDVRLD